MAGILDAGYRLLDPILPFDKYLDPRFGGGSGAPQAAPQPAPQAPRGLYGPEMGGEPPRAPQMGQQPVQMIGQGMGLGAGPQAPMAAPAPRRKPTLTDTIWGVLAGHSPGMAKLRAEDAYATADDRDLARQQAAEAQRRAAEEDAMARRVFGADESGYLAWRGNREATGEALASRQEDYTLNAGGIRGRGNQVLVNAPTAPLKLSPGEVAFDPSGREIASAPFRPEVINLSPGSSAAVIDPNTFSPPSAGSSIDIPTASEAVKSLFPGAVITSGARSPSDNKRVGGAANSYHLKGQALDIVPPPGVTVGQMRAQLQAQGLPVAELIDEGDHIHWAFGGGGGGARQPTSRIVASGGEKPKYRVMSASEKEAMGLDPKGKFQVSPEGQITAIGAAEKPPTEGQRNTASLTFAVLGGNDRMNALAEQGIFKPTPQLVVSERNGVTRLIASNEKDRLFVQAAKEFLAPILRKDTGAAVTDSEFQFYQDTYIPRPEDSPTVLWRKAQARDTAIRRLYGAGRKAYDEEYGPPPKWKVLTDPSGRPGAKKPVQRSGGGVAKMSDAELKKALGL